MLNEGLTLLGKYDKRIDMTGVHYYGVFQESGLEEITLPSTLKEIGDNAFRDCDNLRVILVENGCSVYIKNKAKDSAEVTPVKTIIGNRLL